MNTPATALLSAADSARIDGRGLAAASSAFLIWGLLQYIGPTLQLMLAVLVFGEPFSRPRMAGFALIWTALAIYAADGLWRARKLRAVS